LLQLLQGSILKIPASGTDFQNTGFLPASVKFAVKYRPGRLHTGGLATLVEPGEHAEIF